MTTADTATRRQRRAGPRRRGVSLIEALVALTVMAFGMLSLVGVQATLRLNNDLAKQRSEATWIAVQELERLRTFTALQIDNTRPGASWAEILSRTVAEYSPPESIANTTYRVQRDVITPVANNQAPGLLQKILKVEVTWNDRKGSLQSVVLDGVVGGVDPTLSGLLAVPAKPSVTNQVNQRDATIPPDAVIQPDGRARFVPPGSVNTAWYFNTATGAMFVCDTTGGNCHAARLVSGRVRFDRGPTLTVADPANPQGPALNLADGPTALQLVVPPDVLGVTYNCYADSYGATALAVAPVSTTGIKYYCAVFSPSPAGWGGKLNPRLVDSTGTVLTPGVLSSDIKICRYTPSADDYGANVDHPKTYCVIDATVAAQAILNCTATRVIGNLINQNFLVIPGNLSCPSDTAIDLAAGKLTSFNTQQQLP